jgi:DNA-binding MarR family transcriptional regulator
VKSNKTPSASLATAPTAPPAGSARRASAHTAPPQATPSGDDPWPGGLTPAGEGVAASPKKSGPYQSVGFTISTAGYAIARRFREILAPLQLEPREFALLRAVSAAEGLSQQAISERLQIPASRMVAFVDALAARGLLERRQNQGDRRAHALHLTDEGHHLLQQATAVAAAHERGICADLSAPEREQLLSLLQRVAACLGLPRGVHSALADE